MGFFVLLVAFIRGFAPACDLAKQTAKCVLCISCGAKYASRGSSRTQP
jgi:hypothetical protein